MKIESDASFCNHNILTCFSKAIGQVSQPFMINVFRMSEINQEMLWSL